MRIPPPHLGRLAQLTTVLAVALLLALPAAAIAGTTSTSSASSELALVDLVNGYRAEHGLPALTPRSDLYAAARGWSTELAERQQLAHNPDLAGQVCCWRALGENVARTTDADSATARARTVFDLWRASGPHDAAMLDPGFDQIGTGVVVDAGGRVWTTAVFRLCDGTRCAGGAQGPAGDAATGAEPAPQPAPQPEPEPEPAAAPDPEPEPEPEPAPAPAPTPAPTTAASAAPAPAGAPAAPPVTTTEPSAPTEPAAVPAPPRPPVVVPTPPSVPMDADQPVPARVEPPSTEVAPPTAGRPLTPTPLPVAATPAPRPRATIVLAAGLLTVGTGGVARRVARRLGSRHPILPIGR